MVVYESLITCIPDAVFEDFINLYKTINIVEPTETVVVIMDSELA